MSSEVLGGIRLYVGAWEHGLEQNGLVIFAGLSAREVMVKMATWVMDHAPDLAPDWEPDFSILTDREIVMLADDEIDGLVAVMPHEAL